MTNTYARSVSALFCLFLGGMLLWSLLLSDRARSETENRTLQQLPALTLSAVLDGSYMEEMESYLSDQFPLRDQWTGLHARAEVLAGKTEFHGVYLCGDTLIAKVEPPDAALAEKNLGFVSALSERVEAPVYLGLIPTAAEIWRGRLPAGAESWDQAAYLRRAGELGLPTADFFSALSAHADEPVFYRTDHHWTTLGAYYGCGALLSAMGRGDELPPLETYTRETASDDFNGTLYSTSGIHFLPPDTMEFWVAETGIEVESWRSGAAQAESLYSRDYLTKKDKYSAFLGGNQPLCVIRNDAAPEGSLLLVRDSYADALAPFLSQFFSQIHLIDLRYYHSSVSAYASEHGIDTVAVVYGAANFVTDRNLALLGQ